ncbi:MAG: hypothetical protein PHS41_10915, partial [Victivallaceae bacterium]|nr:hypothetical protein [Victivallaceae bacterium]
MKPIILILVCASLSIAKAAPLPGAYQLLKHGNAANASLSEVQKGSIVLQMKSVEKGNYIIACSNLAQPVTAQQKLMFRVCGWQDYSAGSHITIVICYTDGISNQWKAATGPSLSIQNGEFRNYTLGLDSDFGLSDGAYTIRQVKFVLNGGAIPVKTPITVKISDIRIGNAAEGTNTNLMTIVPSAISPRPVANTGKIFFELENDDRSPSCGGARLNRWINRAEPRLPAGFADLILVNTEGILSETTRLEEADIILYARVTPGKNADGIVKALKAGKIVIASGVIPDPALAALSGSAITEKPITGLPPRASLALTESGRTRLHAPAVTGAKFAKFLHADARPGVEMWMTFGDDRSAYLTANGTLYHLTGAFGATVEKSEVFFDKFLLRLLSARSPKQWEALIAREKSVTAARTKREQQIVTRAASAAGVSPDGYQLGASERNFGRFGWRIGVGLGTGVLNDDLSFSIGDQSYRVSASSGDVLPLPKWTLRAQSSTIKLPPTPEILSQWSGVGEVEYTTEITVPESWRGKEIALEVLDGIDDVDQFFWNNEPAGRTGEETPNHWMAPRRYLLPPKKIEFGKPNRLRLVVGNLRGDAAVRSVPRLTAKEPNLRLRVTVPEINWTGRVCRVSDNVRHMDVRQSLLSPFLEHWVDSKTLFLSQENIGRYAAWQKPDGKVTIRKLSAPSQVVYDLRKNGKWGAPWMLLFREGEGRPLLVVFNRQPEQIRSVVYGDTLSGLSLQLPDGGGVVSTAFPFGAAKVCAEGWSKELPEVLVRKIKQLCVIALNPPRRCHEIFRVDREKKKIDVVHFFEHEAVLDDWNTPKTPYAFLPPLTAHLAGRKQTIELPEPYENFQIPTVYGPTVGVWNKAAVRYRMELPEIGDLQIPGIVDAKLNALQNEFFADALQWSCGGNVRMEDWTPAQPNGAGPDRNIDLFAWNFGLNSAMQGRFFLTKANRAGLDRRIRLRYLEPVERYPFKAVVRHRIEPFSRLTYPVLFQSYYKSQTAFAPDSASAVLYADANEAHTVAMWMIPQLEDLAGQSGLAQANWNFIRYLARYQMCIDDYAFQSGSCRDSGVGAWIDMLN